MTTDAQKCLDDIEDKFLRMNIFAFEAEIKTIRAALQSTRKPDDNGERLARECHGSIFKGRMQTWVHKIVCSKAIIQWDNNFQPSLEHEIMAIAQSAFDTAKNLLKAATRKPPVTVDTKVAFKALEVNYKRAEENQDETVWLLPIHAERILDYLASLDAVLGEVT